MRKGILEAASAAVLIGVTAVCLAGLWFRHTRHEQMLRALQQLSATEVAQCVRQGEDVNLKTDTGISPLMVAADNGRTDLVREFLARGAEVNSCDVDRATPFLWAMTRLDSEGLSALLAAGADIHAHNRLGNNALDLAAKLGTAETITWLLQHGFDVNTRGPDGDTPLFSAVRRGDERAVEALLTHGADPNASVVTTSALDLAEQLHTPSIAKLLRRYGGHSWRMGM